MNRTYVLAHPIQYTPGGDTVMIPVKGVAPELPNLEAVTTTKEALFPAAAVSSIAANAPAGTTLAQLVDGAVKAAALAGLQAVYVGDTIQVLTAAEWAATPPQ